MTVFNIEKAISFLESQYDPEVCLLKEAPVAKPGWFWLWIDNYLAMIVLNLYQRHHPLALKIMDGLRRYPDCKRHRRMEVVVDDPAVVFPWVWPSKTVIAKIGDKKVWNEVCDGPVISTWESYADLLFLASIYYQLKGGFLSKLRAKHYFNKGKGMWDALGFKDAITRASSYYAVYKLALFMIASWKLGIKSDLENKCSSLIGQYQAPSSGGVWTDYYYTGDVKGADVNTETTSLCVLAHLRV